MLAIPCFCSSSSVQLSLATNTVTFNVSAGTSQPNLFVSASAEPAKDMSIAIAKSNPNAFFIVCLLF